jgi:hypothetical protein
MKSGDAMSPLVPNPNKELKKPGTCHWQPSKRNCAKFRTGYYDDPGNIF